MSQTPPEEIPLRESILASTKKNLGIADDYTHFDDDIILHINSVFSDLNQLGVGPLEGFMIEDRTALWNDFLLENARLNSVKSYMYLRVRLLFDPPGTSYHINSMEEQIKKLEWRLEVARGPEVVDELEPYYVVDGGAP